MCQECAARLVAAIHQEEKAAQETTRVVRTIGEMSHWTPYIHHDTKGHTLQAAFHSAALKCAEVVPEGVDNDALPGHPSWNTMPRMYGPGDSLSYRQTLRLIMAPEIAEALEHLHKAAKVALNNAYDEGVKRGRSILLNLAEGDLSINDFNGKGA